VPAIAAARAKSRREAIEECAHLCEDHVNEHDGPLTSLLDMENFRGCAELIAGRMRSLK
jgi:hypothetical protein